MERPDDILNGFVLGEWPLNEWRRFAQAADCLYNHLVPPAALIRTVDAISVILDKAGATRADVMNDAFWAEYCAALRKHRPDLANACNHFGWHVVRAEVIGLLKADG